MKKTLSNIGSMLVLLFFLINILLNSNSVNESIALAFKIWKENLFPFLFPMFVISEVMLSFGIIEILGLLGKKVVERLFHAKQEATYIFVMSLLTGFPSSAKYINTLYENGKLDDNDASKILLFTHFSNPLFIIGTIATTFLGNPKLAILIFICHYLSNIIIGIIFKNYHPIKKDNKMSSLDNHFKEIKKNPRKRLGTILANAIVNSINTLLLILGTISIFLIITSILNSFIDCGEIGNAIINGIIEMSQGLKYVSLLDVSLEFKTIMSIMIISFGGLSVHLQVMSILSNTKVKYLPFLLARILHAIISGIMAYFLFSIIIN